MSLSGLTARYLLLTALLITLLGSVGSYALIHRKIRHEVDEILVSEVTQMHYRLRQQNRLPLTANDDNPHVERVAHPIRPVFSDLELPDVFNGRKPMQVRQLLTTVAVGDRHYLVRVRQPYYEFNELARDLSVGVIVGFLLLMTLAVLIGLGLSSRLWRPFYATISQLNQFRLDQPASPTFSAAHVREFALLNQSLTELTGTLRQQFSLQKQFTENAAHELQTPLAVSAAELDFLRQSPRLTAPDHAHLQRATDALSRLSQLNRSLLLLTQLDNDQFATSERLPLSELLTGYVLDFEPFFTHKDLTSQLAIQPDVWVWMNRQLVSLLLSNLLKNVARHCPPGGRVTITLTSAVLRISNTGAPLPFAENLLFHRFVKNPAQPDSIGLGLALVKQISDRYGLRLTYRYNPVAGEHTFQVDLAGAAH